MNTDRLENVNMEQYNFGKRIPQETEPPLAEAEVWTQKPGSPKGIEIGPGGKIRNNAPTPLSGTALSLPTGSKILCLPVAVFSPTVEHLLAQIRLCKAEPA